MQSEKKSFEIFVGNLALNNRVISTTEIGNVSSRSTGKIESVEFVA